MMVRGNLPAATRHGSAHGWRFGKAFHVSPFLPLDREYAWRLQPPGDARGASVRPPPGAPLQDEHQRPPDAFAREFG